MNENVNELKREETSKEENIVCENKLTTQSNNDNNKEVALIKNEFISKKRNRNHILEGSRSIENYEHLNKIDEGSYGVVFRGKEHETNTIVAIKKVKLHKEKEGFPITSIREINILLSLHHENIIKVNEVVIGNSIDKIFMVMEYMDHELKALLADNRYKFSLSQVKCLTYQLLKGVQYMHSNWIFHRDLKTSNLLFNNKGVLKIADFGLARKYGNPLRPYTQLVVTLWYRAPELLLGCDKYGASIDMWSVGCIIAEILLRDPLFQGQEEIDQLNKIFRMLGTPTEEVWPEWSLLPGVKKINFKKFTQNKLRERFPKIPINQDDLYLSDVGLDLINKLLIYDPNKRMTAEAALKHPWFKEHPSMCSVNEMPIFPELNDKEREISKKNRKKSLDDVQIQQRENLYGDEERGHKEDIEYLDK